MEIRELRAFIAVAEEGSLSGAARTLHLSQSALSQTVLSLERQLGVRLLSRSSTGVTLTEAGSVLMREGRGLIAQHDRVLAEVTSQATAGSGVLRVGVPLELPDDLLPRAFASVVALFPGTSTDVRHASTAAQLAELRAGSLDVALLRECPADPGFDAVLAVSEPLGVLLSASRAAELAGPTGVRLHDLAGLDWLSFPRAESPAWHDQITATLRAHGIAVREASEGPLIAEVKLASVGAGQAFALAPASWNGRLLPDGVAWQPLAGNPLVRRTWAVWPADSRRRDLAALVAALDASVTGLSICGRIMVVMTTVTRQVPDLSFLLNHASYVLRTRMDAAFAEIGMTPRAYCVLAKAMSGEYTQIELAKLSDLDKTTMVITLDELERLGYAERRPSPVDRRARIVAVTPAGATAVADGTRIADRVHNEVLDALPPDQREVFKSALLTLTTGLLADPVDCDRPVRRPRTQL